MTFPTHDDQGQSSAGGYWTDTWISVEEETVELEEPKPRLDWLLLAVLIADLGLWVGLLAWWIWR